MNKEQIEFIKTLLDDELMRLLIKRSKSKSIKEFDEIFNDRINYIRNIISDLNNGDNSDCKYCSGKWSDRKSLLYRNKDDYKIKINTCNYLEENRKGGLDNSIYGKLINYCPMCGRRLG